MLACLTEVCFNSQPADSHSHTFRRLGETFTHSPACVSFSFRVLKHALRTVDCFSFTFLQQRRKTISRAQGICKTCAQQSRNANERNVWDCRCQLNLIMRNINCFFSLSESFHHRPRMFSFQLWPTLPLWTYFCMNCGIRTQSRYIYWHTFPLLCCFTLQLPFYCFSIDHMKSCLINHWPIEFIWMTPKGKVSEDGAMSNPKHQPLTQACLCRRGRDVWTFSL